jgi:hypothetical protein
MSSLHARWRAFLALNLCLVLASAASAAEGDVLGGAGGPAAGGGAAAELDTEAHIEAVLAQPAKFEFVDTSLADIAAYVTETYRIPVILDASALEDAGITTDQLVTGQFDGIRLESALNLLLRPLDLDFTIADEVLLITTQEVINNTRRIRVYPIADLLNDERILDGAEVNPASGLLNIIQAAVEPESWDKVGGPGAIEYSPPAGAIVCSQTRRVHRQIEQLLTELRRARQAQSAVQASAPRGDEYVLRFYRIAPASTFSGEVPASAAGLAPDLERENRLPSDLTGAIIATVSPTTWQKGGGEGAIEHADDILLVRQTPAVHAEIRQLLTQLGVLRERADLP